VPALFPLSRSRERAGVRASSNQRFENIFKHRIGLLKNIIVPKPNHAKSRESKVTRAFQIFGQAIGVMASIDLHDKSRA